MEWITRLTRYSLEVRKPLIVALLAFLPVTLATADNRLDQFISMTHSKGSDVIDSYNVKDGVVYINFNSSFWGSGTKDEQIRLCNSLANIGFLESMHSTLAILQLDGGNTKVGEISHDAFGPGSHFSANDDYWKYR